MHIIKHTVYILKSNQFISQLIKYGLVGGVGFIIDFGIFWFLNNYLKMNYPFSPFISKLTDYKFSVETIDTSFSHIVSSAIAIINNFILNSYFTFKVTDKKLRRFLSFFGIASVGLVVSTILLSTFIEILGFSDLVAKLVSVVIVAILQFGFNKFFTFKNS